MTNRICKNCHISKPLSEFHSVTTNDVVYHRRVCRKCVAIEHNKKYDKNENGFADKRKAAAVAQRVKDPRRHYKRNIEYWRRHPEKASCTQAVKNAVKSGKLKKLPCSVCGSPKSQAHHPDYSKSLDVIWFCHQHHGEEHRRLNRSTERAAQC